MQKIRKFNTLRETEEAEEDKHEMKTHTRAMVMKIIKRGQKYGKNT